MKIKIKKIVPRSTFHAQCRKGFSFIESMLAVFLVSVGVVAAIGLLASSLRNTLSARDQFVASLLAQEGVELVRNIRDNNWVDNDPTTTSFSSSRGFVSQPKVCLINYDSINTIDCTGLNHPLNSPLNLIGGYYTTTAGGTPTKFERTILISYDAANTNVRTVTSMVIWSGKNFNAIGCTDYNSCINTYLPTCNTANQCAYTQITLNAWGE